VDGLKKPSYENFSEITLVVWSEKKTTTSSVIFFKASFDLVLILTILYSINNWFFKSNMYGVQGWAILHLLFCSSHFSLFSKERLRNRSVCCSFQKSDCAIPLFLALFKRAIVQSLFFFRSFWKVQISKK